MEQIWICMTLLFVSDVSCLIFKRQKEKQAGKDMIPLMLMTITKKDRKKGQIQWCVRGQLWWEVSFLETRTSQIQKKQIIILADLLIALNKR